MILKRRSLLAGALSLSGISVSGAGALSAMARETRYEGANAMSAFRRLAYAENNAPTIWWMDGKKYGVLDGETLLLWEIGTLILAKGAVTSSGSFSVKKLEIFFPFIANSDEILSSWENPYTGKRVDFPVFEAKPFTSVYDKPKSEKVIDTPRGLMNLNVHVHQPRRTGLLVWLDVEEKIRLTKSLKDGSTKTTNITEFQSYSADASDFEEGVGYVKARRDLDLWSDWSENLGMDGFSGGMLTRAQGQKVLSISQLPQRFKTALEKRYPDVLARGAAILDDPEG